MCELRNSNEQLKQTIILRKGYAIFNKKSVPCQIVLKSINYIPEKHFFYPEEIPDLEKQEINIIYLYKNGQKVKKDRIKSEDKVLKLEVRVTKKDVFYDVVEAQNYRPEKDYYTKEELDFLNDFNIRLEIVHFIEEN